jgi:CMP-N-acetylneuraminic acid synthetase
MPRIVAIVPMRHASERVPGKNYRLLAGRPLFHHILATLAACPRIAETVIDTDSDIIREDAARTFPEIEVLDRPPELRDGMVSMNDVLLNDVRRIDADLYLQTHSTNPLVRPETVTRAIDAFIDDDAHDSLFSVSRLQARLWSIDGEPMNHDRDALARTQDLRPVYEENSCLYLFSRESLERHGNRIGERPMLFELPRDEAWDIDDEADFRIAEALYRQRQSA